jgi:zinc and cadmium transporter
MILLYIIAATLVVGLISLVGAVFLGLKLDVKKMTFYLISLASGTMLGASFLHLIPESLEFGTPKEGMLLVALGVFIFFVLEKLLIWRHCHHHHRPEDHKRPTAAGMVLVGDSVHNFIDGIIIASSFMVSPAIGVSITLAIILHEIPQELGDFGVLVHGGYSVKKALLFNFLSSLTALLGSVLTYFFIGFVPQLQNFIIPVVAGGFLYIALADLIPQLHEFTAPRQTIRQIGLLVGGFLLMLFTLRH